MDAKKAAQMFIDGKVDAAVTWEPHLSRAEKDGKGHILASSKNVDVENTIVDVLTVDNQYLVDKQANVEKLIKGWFKAVEYLRPGDAKRNAAIEEVCKVFGWHRDEYNTLIDSAPYADFNENRKFFESNAGSSEFQKLMRTAQNRWNSELTNTNKLNVNPVDGDGSSVFLAMVKSGKIK
jgi:NitT/TauT family transport system substrate-binding protein